MSRLRFAPVLAAMPSHLKRTRLKNRLLVFAALLLAILLTFNLSPSTTFAQDPIDGALATLAAATSNAQASRWRAAQQATRQAVEIQATAEAIGRQQAVEATAAAASAHATATANAIAADATRQAYQASANATATSAAQAAALDAQATRAAYDLAYQRSQEQVRVGLALLYAVAAVCLAGCARVVYAWVRVMIEQIDRLAAPSPAMASYPPSPGPANQAAGASSTPFRNDPPSTASSPPFPGGIVIDVLPLALPGPAARMGTVRVFDDPTIIARAVEFFDGLPGGGDE